ncbi:MAG TPA: molybdenum cofactor guanylyltransferase [bacterium]
MIYYRVSGAILAGGKSSRLGRPKQFLEIEGKRLIDRQVELFMSMFRETIVVCKSVSPFLDQPCTIVKDIIEHSSPLAGIYTGLKSCRGSGIFVAACDMPYLKKELIEQILVYSEDYDVVVPQLSTGFEPLHAFYSKNCLSWIEKLFEEQSFRIYDLYKKIRAKHIVEEDLLKIDPTLNSFTNINTEEDLNKLKS